MIALDLKQAGPCATCMRRDENPTDDAGGVSVLGVTHGYARGSVAVDDATLRVRPREVHALLGPSGGGKSTLLRLIAGLEAPRVGRITIGGVEVAGGGVHVPPERRAVGFVFQDYALFPHLNARRNVTFGMSGPRRGRADAADELLRRVGLPGLGRAMPHALSGGQQQRVALARALARGPAVMLLDEPFSGLDADLRDRVRDETLSLLRGSGVATLMVTHDPHEALVAADRVSVMRDGRVTATGRPDDVCVCTAAARGATVVRLRHDLRGRAPATA